MKRIAFFITKLDIGGAERVLIDLVNELKIYYDIKIITLYGGGTLEKECDASIISINTFEKKGLSKKFYAFLLKFPYFHRKIINQFFKDYDLVVAFLEGVPTEILSTYKGPKIAFVHTNLGKHYSKIYNYFKKYIYNKYNEVVAVSKDSFDSLKDINAKKSVIYNYISNKRINSLKKAYEVNEKDYILTVARLFEEKGVIRIFDINDRLLKNGIKLNFIIIGDGPLRAKLETRIKKDKISNIKLLGSKSNPYPYMNKASLVFMPSYYEGLSLVALETRLLNRKILLTKTGAVEALMGYKYAYVVENSDDALYRALVGYYNKKLKATKLDGQFDNKLESYKTLLDRYLMI